MAQGDKWAPVSDGDNTWIQTGNGGEWSMLHKQCWTHSELGHGEASWGKTGLKYGAGGDGRGLCCSGKGLRCLRSLFALCMLCMYEWMYACMCVRAYVCMNGCVYVHVCKRLNR